ncbi:MAG: flagellar hook-length control protein FliK [Clostridia bacterium]|nr:flagellar hook-length control protein FliK [Clostridia bacterium]
MAAPGVWGGSPTGVRVSDRPATGRHDAADAPDMTAAAMDGRRTAEARPASAPGVSMPANHDRTAAHDAKTLARATGGTEANVAAARGALTGDATVTLAAAATGADHRVSGGHEAIPGVRGDLAGADGSRSAIGGGTSTVPGTSDPGAAPAASVTAASPVATGVQVAAVPVTAAANVTAGRAADGAAAANPSAVRGAGGTERDPGAVQSLRRAKGVGRPGTGTPAGTPAAATGEHLVGAGHAAATGTASLKGAAAARAIRGASPSDAGPWSPELAEGQAPQDPLAAALRGGANPSWRMRLDGGPLGPLGVHVEARHAMVAAHFQAQPDTAALLQQTADQLAGSLAQQGLSLAQFGVNDQAWRGAPGDHSADPEPGRAGAAARSTVAGFSRGGVTRTSAIPGAREWQM